MIIYEPYVLISGCRSSSILYFQWPPSVKLLALLSSLSSHVKPVLTSSVWVPVCTFIIRTYLLQFEEFHWYNYCRILEIRAAHVSFEVAQVNFTPQLWYFSLILRRTSDFHGRTSDFKILLIPFNIPLHIFWIPVYACRCPPFVGIVAKVAERQKTASPIHVTILAQIGYAAPAGTAAQAEYFTNTPQ